MITRTVLVLGLAIGVVALAVPAFAGASASTRSQSGASSAMPTSVSTLVAGDLEITADGARDCPSGWSCQQFTVRCPGVRDAARGEIAVLRADTTTNASRGLSVFYSGGYGTEWWSQGGALTRPFFEGLRAQGLGLVQIRWVDSWLRSAPGEEAGPARLACRTASTVRWIHEHLYRPSPLAIPAGAGRCGFCITGNSGGSSQVTYALAFYGLADIVDGMVPTGGPPHAAIAKGCLDTTSRYAYEPWAQAVMDASYGYRPGTGPCAHHDRTYQERWQRDSVDGAGAYRYPRTRVEVILGGADDGVAPVHAHDYIARLTDAGQPVTTTVVPGMPHHIQGSADGLAALSRALLGR